MTSHILKFTAASAIMLALGACVTEGDLNALENMVDENNASAPEAPKAKPPVATATGTTGRTVQQVKFENGAWLASTGPGTWAEYQKDGKVAFTFTEARRDDWSVYLDEVGSSKNLQIDVHRKKLLVGYNNDEKSDLYNIVSVSDTVTPPPSKYTSEGVNGPNLARVKIGDAKAAFEQTAPGVWTEYNQEGKVFNTFTETRRDDWSVYVEDKGRYIQLQFDVHRKMILLAQDGGDLADQWPITAMDRLR